MGLFILRRFGVMLLTALCLTFVVFFLTNLYPNLEKLAKTQGNQRMSDEQVEAWLDNRGYLATHTCKIRPMAGRDARFPENSGGWPVCGHLHKTRFDSRGHTKILWCSSGRLGVFHRFQGRSRHHRRKTPRQYRLSDVLGFGPDGAICADRRCSGRDARGIGAGSVACRPSQSSRQRHRNMYRALSSSRSSPRPPWD